VPPAVQTELMAGNSVNEHFLPLDAFADEVMALLEAQPDAREILVEAVKFLRYSEVEGRYTAAIAALNTAA
jgi:short-subunit dehydrogenase involved in D-alanine esterification of teichoic acids